MVFPHFPSVHPYHDTPPHCLRIEYMPGGLKNFRLKDDKSLDFPVAIPYVRESPGEFSHELEPHLPSWCIVSTQRHDCEVMPPVLPYYAIYNSSIYKTAIIYMHTIEIDCLHSLVLWCQDVARKISLCRFHFAILVFVYSQATLLLIVVLYVVIVAPLRYYGTTNVFFHICLPTLSLCYYSSALVPSRPPCLHHNGYFSPCNSRCLNTAPCTHNKRNIA